MLCKTQTCRKALTGPDLDCFQQLILLTEGCLIIESAGADLRSEGRNESSAAALRRDPVQDPPSATQLCI